MIHRINLNDQIKVKLTDLGKKIYYHRFDATNQIAGREVCKPCFPKEDEDGYTKFQLWDFIRLYGPHIDMILPNVVLPLEMVWEEAEPPEKRTEERTETHACDSISRQAAIDALGTPHGILYPIRTIEELPSVQPQPEIIRCKDCKWWDKSEDSPFGYCMAMKHGYMSTNWEIGIYRRYKGDFYCADAERRTDG